MTVTRVKIFVTKSGALFVFDKKVLRKTLRQAGQEVVAVSKNIIRASSGTPGGPPKSRTGQLLRSFKVTSDKSGLLVTVANLAADKNGRPYSLFLESGVQYQTSPVNRPKRKHRKRTVALVPTPGMTTVLPRPYLSFALDLRRLSLAQRIQSAVQDGITFTRVKP